MIDYIVKYQRPAIENNQVSQLINQAVSTVLQKAGDTDPQWQCSKLEK